MNQTYWNSAGKHQKSLNSLRKLVPPSGPVVRSKSNNRNLEKFRKAVNCYYDLYNNGLLNRVDEFRRVFKLNISEYKLGTERRIFADELYERVENEMDQIIVAAAKEQGISV